MAVELTPTDKLFIMNLDQNEFQGFSYTNPEFIIEVWRAPAGETQPRRDFPPIRAAQLHFTEESSSTSSAPAGLEPLKHTHTHTHTHTNSTHSSF